MSTNSNFDRISEAWLAEGPTQLADRVLDAALDEVHLTRQRRRLPVPWRFDLMPVPMRLVAAAAAVLVLAVVGWNLLPKQPTTGGPNPSPSLTPGPSETPTGTPVASGPIALPEGRLTGGAYQIHPSTSVPTFSLLADIPAEWEGFPANAALIKSLPGAPDQGVLIGFMIVDGLFSDPCHWDLDGSGDDNQPGDVVVGPTVEDLVAGLEANTSYTSSTPSNLTFGDVAGRELELEVPLDLVLEACDTQANPRYFVFSSREGSFYAQGPGPGYREDLFIVDAGGTRLVTMVGYYDGVTPQADVDAARTIVESFEFTP